MVKTLKKKKKTIERKVDKVVITINSSFNNTAISAINKKGEVLAWATAGSAGFKGTRKATPYAATETAKRLIEKLRNFEIKEGELRVAGVGSGREAAVRAFGAAPFAVAAIKEITPVPHNGPRAKKPRRV